MTVYDFDNTIYQGESGFDLFIYYIKKDPKSILRYIPKFLECCLKYKLGKITVDEVINDYGVLFKEFGSNLTNLESDIKTFWDINEKKIKSFYGNIRTDEDVIVSACPEFLLSEICNRIGIKNYIGSILDVDTWEIKRVCYKDVKIEAFYERYGKVEIDDFYTDSIRDKPMMDISKNVYYVTDDRIEKIKANGIYLNEKFKEM